MRVLHLIDAASPQATGSTFALMASAHGRLGHIDQQILLLGGDALAARSESAGLCPDARFGVPFGRAVLGAAGLRRRAEELGGFDLIHCWSVGAFAAALIAFRRQPLLLTLTVQPSKRTARWLRILTRESSSCSRVILTASSTIRRTLLSHGVDPACVHVLRPAIELSRVDSEAQKALRDGWSNDPSRAFVVAVLCDPPHSADAQIGALTLALASECSPMISKRLALLVHPKQSGRLRSENLLEGTRQGVRIIQDARIDRPWEVLPGCDAALAYGPNAGGLSLLWAMASSVPIVGEATYAISEIVEDRHSALLTRPESPKDLARRIVRLHEDEQLGWKLCDTARHEAYSYFSRVRYCQSLQQVYEQTLSNRAVEIAPMEATGGLRFMEGAH